MFARCLLIGQQTEKFLKEKLKKKTIDEVPYNEFMIFANEFHADFLVSQQASAKKPPSTSDHIDMLVGISSNPYSKDQSIVGDGSFLTQTLRKIRTRMLAGADIVMAGTQLYEEMCTLTKTLDDDRLAVPSRSFKDMHA